MRIEIQKDDGSKEAAEDIEAFELCIAKTNRADGKTDYSYTSNMSYIDQVRMLLLGFKNMEEKSQALMTQSQDELWQKVYEDLANFAKVRSKELAIISTELQRLSAKTKEEPDSN